MRSERRHELQHNELAEWLFKAGQRVKPYQNAILAAVVALVVVVAAYTVWSRTSAAKTAAAWTDLANAMDSPNPDDALASVIESHPNTSVAYVAALLSADERLARGCNERFGSKAVSQRELNSAIASYSSVLEQCRTPALRERATYGLARAKEAQGDLAEAKKNYETVATWPDGTYASAANQRLDDLKQRETKIMFDDLRNYEAVAAFSEQPEVPGLTPNFDRESVPEEKPIKTPDTKPTTKVDDKKPATKVDDKKPATKVDDKKPAKGVAPKK
jgi:hypothetical protein